MTLKKVKYNIIIPAYNAEKKIRILINSILDIRNVYSDFDVTVVNDGSTDKTRKICEEYVNRYNYIKLINQDNSGANIARKNGFNHTIGEYVIFVDADDFLEKNYFQEIEKILKNKEYDVLEYSFNKVDESFNLISNVILNSHYVKDDLIKFFLTSKDTRNFLWNKVIKRSILKAEDFEPLFYGEDACVLVKVFSRCNSYFSIKKILYNYVLYSDSACSIKYSKRHMDILKSDDICFDFLNNNKYQDLLFYLSIRACSHSAKLYAAGKYTGLMTENDKKIIKKTFKFYYNNFSKNKKKNSLLDISKKKILSIRIFNISPTLYCFLFKNMIVRKR